MNQIIPEKISPIEDGDIDLKELLNSICRKKVYFLGVSSISLLIGILYAFTAKPL